MRAVYLKDKNGNKLVSVPYYRVGDLFLTTIATNPSSYLGGTWELFGPGRCLVCVDTSQTEFNSVKKTGGAKTHKLTVDEMPGHSHMFSRAPIYYHENEPGQTVAGSLANTFAKPVTYTESTGGSKSHNNLQPFITCYVWIRIA